MHLLKQLKTIDEEGIKEVNKKIDMHHCPINRNCLKKVTLPDYAVNFFYSFLLILCYAFVPFTEVPTKRQTFFIFFFVGGFLIHQF